MPAFAINAVLPSLRTMATAASTEVYRTANSSGEMPELTEAPLGEDKSKTRRTEPSVFTAAPMGGAMEEPERRADERACGMSPGDLQGHRGGDG